MDRPIKKNNWPPQKIAMYVGIPLIAITFIAMLARTFGASRFRVDKDRLTIATISHGPFQEFIPINGEVLPIRTVYVDAIMGGQVEELYLEGGEMVSKGALILKLRNADQELSFMNLETNLLEQADQLRNTRITLEERGLNLREQLLLVEADIIAQKILFERNEKLYKDSVISEQEYLDAKNPYEYSVKRIALIKERILRDSLLRDQQLAQVESSLSLVERNLNAIQRNMQNLIIKAPIEGQLSSIRVEIGETVGQGQNLGQIDVLDGYKVRAQIDEHYIARIEPGLKGEFIFSGDRHPLVIRKVYPEVLANGAFEVDMEFENDPPDEIKRGQNLQIRLALSDETMATLIPRGGFYQSTGGNYVFKLDNAEASAYKQPIRIGRQSDRFYEVLEGLQEGDKVVTSSYETYKDIDELILQ